MKNMNKGKTRIAVGLIVFATMLSGCATVRETSETKDALQTSKLMNEVNNQIGMPNITNFYEKKMLKEIYELRDRSDLITYTYTTALDGKKVFQFMSMGYGIPMSVQYSNPQTYKGVVTPKVVQEAGEIRDWTYAYDMMPQAEPNGLFMPEGLSATWIIRVNDDGSTEPVYMEETIMVVQTKLPARLCAEWSLPSDY